MVRTGIFTLILIGIVTSLTQAQELPSQIQRAIEQYQPQSLLPDYALSKARLQKNNPAIGSVTHTQSGVVELTCDKSPESVIDLQLVVSVPTMIHKGDTLLLIVKAQSLSLDPAYDFGLVFLNFERNVKWTKSLGYTAKLNNKPKWLAIPFTAREDFPADEGRLTFPIGFFPQTLKLSELRLLNFGKQIAVDDLSTEQYQYEGYAPDAAWRTEAANSIEKNRKAPIKLTIVNAQGKPIRNDAVHIQMQRHAFAFGTAVNEWKFVGDDPDQVIYKQKIDKLFNTAAMESCLKWKSWLRSGNQQRVEATMQWLADHDIDIRGHTMVWPSWKKSPDALLEQLKADPQFLRQQVFSYIREVGNYCKGRVVEWDVVNEVHSNHDYLDMLGDQEIDKWFHAARSVDRDVPLLINEFGIIQGKGGYELPKQDKHFQLVKGMLDRGVPIDALGFQSHFRLYSVTPPKRVWEILDRYAKLDLKLGITEYDLAWVDEAFQARYLHDFMTACFAHPSVNQFVMWGFWDGSHWREDGGMFAKDWREKPSLNVYKDLVFNQWWTDQTIETDAQGQIQARGFLGEYKLTFKVNGKTVTRMLSLPKQGSEITIAVP